jgi:DNA polymerase epsilon subunit 2
MLDALDARSLTSSIVDKQVVDETTRALDRAAGVTGVEMDARGVPAAHGCSTHDPDDGITIVDAFEMPKLAYDAQRRTFYEKIAVNDATRDATVDAEADSKIELYRERFKLLQQRISRHRMFTKPSFECGGGANDARAYCELTPLTGLLGAAGETRYVMGCLSQLEDDRFFLEDLTGTIQIDLSNAATSSGLFTENCIVVAEGEVRVADGVFEARALGFPPAESREESAVAAAHRDFFGAGRLRPADIARLLKSEATSTSDMFVVMSDVWLDRAATFRRLRAVFEGFDSLDTAPAMFVLMGDFCSKPCHLGGGGGAGARAGVTFKAYARGFDRLASLIEEFPRLREECRWVFVPGPGDPGVAAALPRPALRRSTLGRLPEALPRATFASNPARVRYKSQDLVFMRENLQSRMRRACVLPPTLAEPPRPGRRRRRRGPAAKAFARSAPRRLRAPRATTRASTMLET